MATSVVDEAGAIWIGSPNFWVDRRGLGRPKWLIVHGTAGGQSAESVAHSEFVPVAKQVSAHYIVGRDGHVVQCVLEKDAAWANGGVTEDLARGLRHDPWWSPNQNPNIVTISVEHVKSKDDNSDGLTPAQEAASFKLIENICNRHGIPKRKADANGGITGHFSMDPVNKARCPGIYPFDRLFQYLGRVIPSAPTVASLPVVTTNTPKPFMGLELSMPGVAQFYEAGPHGSWRRKGTDYIIEGDILRAYCVYGEAKRGYGIGTLGLPMGDATLLKDGTAVQRFEKGVLTSDIRRLHDHPPFLDPKEPVYPMHIDTGLGADPQVGILQTIVGHDRIYIGQMQGELGQAKDALSAKLVELNTVQEELAKAASQLVELQGQLATEKQLREQAEIDLTTAQGKLTTVLQGKSDAETLSASLQTQLTAIETEFASFKDANVSALQIAEAIKHFLVPAAPSAPVAPVAPVA